jgi:hypothetical protein
MVGNKGDQLFWHGVHYKSVSKRSNAEDYPDIFSRVQVHLRAALQRSIKSA